MADVTKKSCYIFAQYKYNWVNSSFNINQRAPAALQHTFPSRLFILHSPFLLLSPPSSAGWGVFCAVCIQIGKRFAFKSLSDFLFCFFFFLVCVCRNGWEGGAGGGRGGEREEAKEEEMGGGEAMMGGTRKSRHRDKGLLRAPLCGPKGSAAGEEQASPRPAL